MRGPTFTSLFPIAQVLLTDKGQNCSFKRSTNNFLTFDEFHSKEKVKLTAASVPTFLSLPLALSLLLRETNDLRFHTDGYL